MSFRSCGCCIHDEVCDINTKASNSIQGLRGALVRLKPAAADIVFSAVSETLQQFLPDECPHHQEKHREELDL